MVTLSFSSVKNIYTVYIGIGRAGHQLKTSLFDDMHGCKSQRSTILHNEIQQSLFCRFPRRHCTDTVGRWPARPTNANNETQLTIFHLSTLRECSKCFNPSVNNNICSRALRLENIAKQQLFSGLLSPGVRDKTASFFFLFSKMCRGTPEVKACHLKMEKKSVYVWSLSIRGEYFHLHTHVTSLQLTWRLYFCT